MKKAQTLRAGCSKAEPKILPRRSLTPASLRGGAGRPKFNQLEMVTAFTYKPSFFGEDRCTQFRVIVVTDPQTHTHTHTHTHTNPQTGPITIHYAARLSAQCN